MKHAINRRDAIIGMGSAAVLNTVPLNVFAGSHATVHEVLMLNKDPDDPKKKMLFSQE